MDNNKKIKLAVRVIHEWVDNYDDMYMYRTTDNLGVYLRAWRLLESAWIGDVHINELVGASDLEKIDVPGGYLRRVFWVSELLTTLAAQLPLYGLSEGLTAFITRQCMFSVDPSPLVGAEDGDFAELQAARFWEDAVTGLSGWIHSIRHHFPQDSPAIFDDAGISEPEADLVISEDLPPRLVSDRLSADVITAGGELDPFAVKRLLTEFRSNWRTSPSAQIVARIRDRRENAEQLLRTIQWRLPRHFKSNNALGTYLALTGRAREAESFLRAADELAPEAEQVATRFMLVDCLSALDRELDPDLGDLAAPALPTSQAFMDGIWGTDWTGADEYLIVRGLATEVGKKDPLSSTDPDLTLYVAELEDSSRLSPVKVLTRRDRSDIESIERIEAEQKRMYTDMMQKFADIGGAIDRDHWWADQFARVMPAERRAQIERDLAEIIRSWSKLPPVAQNQLISAPYFTDDPGLKEPERVPASIRAVGLAVECVARTVLPELRSGATVGNIAAHVDDISFGTPEMTKALWALNDLRKDATHSPGRLREEHLHRTWLLALGTKGQPGCIEMFATLRP